jgi:Ca-activated chloride channel family protein
MTGRGCGSFALILLAASGAAAQQSGAFKTGAQTVAVYATVLGQDGRLMPDLPRDAFRIDDNGVRQTLSVFSNDTQPITAVMMLDRSGSMTGEFELVEKAAEAFVDDLGPADQARIGSFSNRIQVDPRAFTSDHQVLLDILRTELQEAGPTPLWNAINVGITGLLHQEGRRVVLVFTDGVDRPMSSSPQNTSLKDVMKRAEQEDVMVYAIGLAGHNGAGGGRGGGFGRRGGGRGRGGFGGGSFGRGGGRTGSAAEQPDKGLPMLAAATGGGYFELTSTVDLAATFRRVADELHHQYLLGFSPAKLDDKLHQLTVTATATATADETTPSGTPVVRARKSYLAAAQR